jgi:hypothetical protein
MNPTVGTIVAYGICLMRLVFVGVIVRFWIFAGDGWERGAVAVATARGGGC